MIDKTHDKQPTRGFLQSLSPHDFLNFGMETVAYVKPISVEGRDLYAVHAANGTPLAVMDSLDEALATTRMNELTPISLH